MSGEWDRRGRTQYKKARREKMHLYAMERSKREERERTSTALVAGLEDEKRRGGRGEEGGFEGFWLPSK